MKKYIANLIILLILSLSIYGIYYFGILVYLKTKGKVIEENQFSNTGIILSIKEDCSFTGTDYKSVDIFGEGNIFKTQATKDINIYTKQISINGYVEEAYICVISNIREDYKKTEAYRFSTYLYMGNSKNAGNINTQFSNRNGVVYDKEMGSNKDINGVFRGNEAPYTQIINLNNVIIADIENGFSKEISPIRLFNDGATIRIGGYTNSYPNRRAGEITKLRIIYKGGNIELSK